MSATVPSQGAKGVLSGGSAPASAADVGTHGPKGVDHARRQILAWGETDIFRLLDGVNHLDNSFGGPFEDLDDRRIPLWMLRSSLNLGMVGPVSSLTLEGFIVPGTLDATVAPWPLGPDGAP